jgi:hypothetical protein
MIVEGTKNTTRKRDRGIDGRKAVAAIGFFIENPPHPFFNED